MGVFIFLCVPLNMKNDGHRYGIIVRTCTHRWRDWNMKSCDSVQYCLDDIKNNVLIIFFGDQNCSFCWWTSSCTSNVFSVVTKSRRCFCKWVMYWDSLQAVRVWLTWNQYVRWLIIQTFTVKKFGEEKLCCVSRSFKQKSMMNLLLWEKKCV